MNVELGVRGAPSSDRSALRRRGGGRLALVVGVVVVVAAGTGVLAARERDSGIDQRGYAPQVTLPAVDRGTPLDVTPADGAAALPAPSATALDAVITYLEAEIVGDAATSFGVISAADRELYGSAEDWASAHDELPQYESFSVVESSRDGVVVDARLVPQLDQIVGVIPSAARVTFAVVAEDGGWRVSLLDSRIEPQYPPDAAAQAAALEWVLARQRCADASEIEYDGSFLGVLGLPEQLCGAQGSPQATQVGGLDALVDPSAVLSAFGADAPLWARVVRVDGVGGVGPLQVVLAPLGDLWRVIGAVAAP